MIRDGGRRRDAWAPFPIQDWHRYARGSRSWRASRRTPRLLLVATLALILVSTGLMFLADRPARSVDGLLPASHWVPIDGAATTIVTSEAGAPTTATVTSGVFPPQLATQSVPFTLGSLLISATRGDFDTTIWRRTVATPDHDRYQLYEAAADIRLLAVSHPEVEGYIGGILLLPSDAVPGDRWESTGETVRERVAWRSEFSAEPATVPTGVATNTCLNVVGTITVGDDTTSVRQVWCRGAGPVSGENVTPEATSTWEPADRLPESVATADPVSDPGPPTGWKLTSRRVVTDTPGVGVEGVSGTASEAPMSTAAGRVVLRAGSDVVVLDPLGDDLLQVRHRLHPGDALVSVATFGDVVLAATVRREIVAWSSATGAVLWRRDLPDTSHPDLRRLDDTGVLVSLTSGEVWALSLTDGSTRWRAPAMPSGSFPALPGVGGVLVTEPGGNVTLRDLNTGDKVWSWSVDNSSVESTVANQDVVWVFTSSGTYGLDPRNREVRTFQRSGTHNSTVLIGDVLVLAGIDGVRAVGPDGTPRWRLPHGCLEVTATFDLAFCWQATRVVVVDATGTTVGEHDLVEHIAGQLYHASTGGGVTWRASQMTGVPGDSWTVYRWAR